MGAEKLPNSPDLVVICNGGRGSAVDESPVPLNHSPRIFKYFLEKPEDLKVASIFMSFIFDADSDTPPCIGLEHFPEEL